MSNLAGSRWFGDARASASARDAFLAGLHGIRLTMPSYVASVPSIARRATVSFPNAYRLAPRRVDQHSTGRKIVISVSGLKTPNKNGVVLAKAFARIADEFPDWDLHYYGGYNLVAQMQPVLKEGDLSKRIVIQTYTEDMDAQYARAHVHAICSFHEGNPNVVCEAMTHGIPSIGYSDCPGTNELIRHQQNGLLIGRDDEVGNLAAALKLLMSDPGLRDRFGREAYAEARTLFDPATIFDEWERLLLRIARYKGAPGRLIDEQSEIDPAEAQRLQTARREHLMADRFAWKIPRDRGSTLGRIRGGARAIWRRARGALS